MNNKTLSTKEIMDSMHVVPEIMGIFSEKGTVCTKGVQIEMEMSFGAFHNDDSDDWVEAKRFKDVDVRFRIFSYNGLMVCYMNIPTCVKNFIYREYGLPRRPLSCPTWFDNNWVFVSQHIMTRNKNYFDIFSYPYFKDIEILDLEVYNVEYPELVQNCIYTLNDAYFVEKGNISRSIYQPSSSESSMFWGTFMTCFGQKCGCVLSMEDNNKNVNYLYTWNCGGDSDPFRINAYITDKNKNITKSLCFRRHELCLDSKNLLDGFTIKCVLSIDISEKQFLNCVNGKSTVAKPKKSGCKVTVRRVPRHKSVK